VGYYYIDAHGHIYAYVAVGYEKSSAGLAQRTADLQELDQDYGIREFAHIMTFTENDHYGIEMWYDGIEYYYTHFNPNASTSTVHLLVCEVHNVASSWGAENVIGYSGNISNVGESEAKTILNKLNGEEGHLKRSLLMAVNGLQIELLGTGGWVLAPTVWEYSPECGEYTGSTEPILVNIRFDADIVAVDLHEMLYCNDGYILEEEHYPGYGPRRVNPDEIEFYAVPFTCPGSFMPVIRSDVAVSAIGGHQLDGGYPYAGDGWGIGPNGDYFGLEYRFADTDPDCDNWAATITYTGAFVEEDRTYVYWQAATQKGSISYDVVDAFGVVVATVPATQVPEFTPVGYLVEVPSEAVSHLLERIERRILWGAINPKRGVN